MNAYKHEIGNAELSRIRRFLSLLAVGTTIFAVLIVVGIVTADRWLLLISHAAERRVSDRYLTWVIGQVFAPADPVLQEYVDGLTRQVSDHIGVPEGLEVRIRVVEGSTVNAFATLGGRIFVFEGLLRELDSENSLAMVLGHEVAHLVNRDPLLGTGRGILVAIAVSYVAGTSVDLSFVDFESLALNVYSREQERAADLVAAQALYRNYGHIGGATRLFSILEATDSGPGTLEVLSTHPDSNRRIQAIESMAEQHAWTEQPTKPYPAEVQTALKKKP